MVSVKSVEIGEVVFKAMRGKLLKVTHITFYGIIGIEFLVGKKSEKGAYFILAILPIIRQSITHYGCPLP